MKRQENMTSQKVNIHTKKYLDTERDETSISKLRRMRIR
jgi:hypothetical protein